MLMQLTKHRTSCLGGYGLLSGSEQHASRIFNNDDDAGVQLWEARRVDRSVFLTWDLCQRLLWALWRSRPSLFEERQMNPRRNMVHDHRTKQQSKAHFVLQLRSCPKFSSSLNYFKIIESSYPRQRQIVPMISDLSLLWNLKATHHRYQTYRLLVALWTRICHKRRNPDRIRCAGASSADGRAALS